MPDDVEVERIDGHAIIAISPEKKAFLLTETAIGGVKVEAIDKAPSEERIAAILSRVGRGAEEVGKKISDLLEKRKQKVSEVV